MVTRATAHALVGRPLVDDLVRSASPTATWKIVSASGDSPKSRLMLSVSRLKQARILRAAFLKLSRQDPVVGRHIVKIFVPMPKRLGHRVARSVLACSRFQCVTSFLFRHDFVEF